jgi:hypothetical protein
VLTGANTEPLFILHVYWDTHLSWSGDYVEKPRVCTLFLVFGHLCWNDKYECVEQPTLRTGRLSKYWPNNCGPSWVYIYIYMTRGQYGGQLLAVDTSWCSIWGFVRGAYSPSHDITQYFHIKWPPLWSSGQSSWGLGFDSRRYQIFWEVVGLERGPLSLMRIIEKLLEWESSDSGQESRINGRGIRCADHATPSLYPQKLALTLPTSGGRSVGIVRLRTKGHGVFPR